MKKTSIREQKIIELLHKRGKLLIKDIAENFNVSEPTARRICTALSRNNNIVRIHGGIQYITQTESKYSFDDLANKYIEEKKCIAQYAASIIKDNEVIFLESGTTIQQLALALVERLDKTNLNNIIIFTNSLINFNILHPHCKVILTGGQYRNERRDFAGFICEKLVRNLQFNSCFLGADAIDLNEGIMASDIDTARFDELITTRSDRPIILADSSKFSRRSLISYAPVNKVSMIITDSKLPLYIKDNFQKSGVNLFCV